MAKAAKNYSNVEKNDAFKYYIENNVSIEQVADDLNMSRSTIRKWATKDSWAEKKQQAREKAQDKVINKIALDMAKVDLDIREEFKNIFFNKCRDLDTLAEMKIDIQNMKTEDVTQAIAKANSITNIVMTETKAIDSLTKVFDRLERRYLPKDAEVDNNINISITSGGRLIKFMGMESQDSDE
jgi:transposase-like protein